MKKYHCCDEYHDSSTLDVKLITNLASKGNLCCILDEDQSIYGFRGANLDSVLNIRKNFKFKDHILNINYRSTGSIVNAARSVIENNPVIFKKTIKSNNDVGNKIILFEENDKEQEANRILLLINLLNKKYKIDYKDMAILYRMSYMSRSLEEALLSNNVPYTITNGLEFLQRKEVKDILSYLRIIYNPYDIESFKRVINIPKRGIGEIAIAKIINYSKEHDNIDFIETCTKIELKGKQKAGLEDFIKTINIIKKSIKDQKENNKKMDSVIEDIVTLYENYLVDYCNKKNEDIEDRIANIKELINIGSSYDSLEDICENLTFTPPSEENGDNNKVNLLTIHASKGLEWKVVFIIGGNDDIYPHYKAQTAKEIQEERRLFYVALTRAKEYLFLTRPKHVQNRSGIMYRSRSKFIDEINSQYIVNYKTNK